jgi:hypothetical protein
MLLAAKTASRSSHKAFFSAFRAVSSEDSTPKTGSSTYERRDKGQDFKIQDFKFTGNFNLKLKLKTVEVMVEGLNLDPVEVATRPTHRRLAVPLARPPAGHGGHRPLR